MFEKRKSWDTPLNEDMSIFPDSTQRKLIQAGQHCLIAGNRLKPLYYLNCRVYRVMERIIQYRLSRIHGIVSLYLSHGLAQGELYPGLSDFDLIVVFDESQLPGFYKALGEQWRQLARYFPVSDIALFTKTEFLQWQKLGQVWDPREELAHWRCIYGEDLRCREWDTSGEQGRLDRVHYSLGHFQNLIQLAVKEEKVSPWFAVAARRQLYKSFCGTVFSLEKKYLEIRKQRERMTAWIKDNGESPLVWDLLNMYKARFFKGNISNLRNTIVAFVWQYLQNAFSALPVPDFTAPPPAEISKTYLPIANQTAAEERARAIAGNLVDMHEDALDNISLFSTGTVRGYALSIVLKDDLPAERLEQFLIDLRAVHRVFDDPWFNEHFPAGIPLVHSQSTFQRRLQASGMVLDYFHAFRQVLFGNDLLTKSMGKQERSMDPQIRKNQFQCERLMFSLHLHQVYLRNLKPALYDVVSCYLPRLSLLHRLGYSPVTAEESVMRFADLGSTKGCNIPKAVMERFGGLDADALKRAMDLRFFDELWPFISQEVKNLELL